MLEYMFILPFFVQCTLCILPSFNFEPNMFVKDASQSQNCSFYCLFGGVCRGEGMYMTIMRVSLVLKRKFTFCVCSYRGSRCSWLPLYQSTNVFFAYVFACPVVRFATVAHYVLLCKQWNALPAPTYRSNNLKKSQRK